MYINIEVIFQVSHEEEQVKITIMQDILDIISCLEATIWAHSYWTASDHPGEPFPVLKIVTFNY